MSRCSFIDFENLNGNNFGVAQAVCTKLTTEEKLAGIRDSLDDAEVYMRGAKTYLGSSKDTLKHLRKIIALAEADVGTAEACVAESQRKINRLKCKMRSNIKYSYVQTSSPMPEEMCKDTNVNLNSTIRTDISDRVLDAVQKCVEDSDIDLDKYEAIKYEQYNGVIVVIVEPKKNIHSNSNCNSINVTYHSKDSLDVCNRTSHCDPDSLSPSDSDKSKLNVPEISQSSNRFVDYHSGMKDNLDSQTFKTQSSPIKPLATKIYCNRKLLNYDTMNFGVLCICDEEAIQNEKSVQPLSQVGTLDKGFQRLNHCNDAQQCDEIMKTQLSFVNESAARDFEHVRNLSLSNKMYQISNLSPDCANSETMNKAKLESIKEENLSNVPRSVNGLSLYDNYDSNTSNSEENIDVATSDSFIECRECSKVSTKEIECKRRDSNSCNSEDKMVDFCSTTSDSSLECIEESCSKMSTRSVRFLSENEKSFSDAIISLNKLLDRKSSKEIEHKRRDSSSCNFKKKIVDFSSTSSDESIECIEESCSKVSTGSARISSENEEKLPDAQISINELSLDLKPMKMKCENCYSSPSYSEEEMVDVSSTSSDVSTKCIESCSKVSSAGFSNERYYEDGKEYLSNELVNSKEFNASTNNKETNEEDSDSIGETSSPRTRKFSNGENSKLKSSVLEDSANTSVLEDKSYITISDSSSDTSTDTASTTDIDTSDISLNVESSGTSVHNSPNPALVDYSDDSTSSVETRSSSTDTSQSERSNYSSMSLTDCVDSLINENSSSSNQTRSTDSSASSDFTISLDDFSYVSVNCDNSMLSQIDEISYVSFKEGISSASLNYCRESLSEENSNSLVNIKRSGDTKNEILKVKSNSLPKCQKYWQSKSNELRISKFDLIPDPELRDPPITSMKSAYSPKNTCKQKFEDDSSFVIESSTDSEGSTKVRGNLVTDSFEGITTNSEQIRNMLCGMQTVNIAKFDTGNEVSTKTDSPLVVTGRLANAESPDSYQIPDTNSEQIRNMLNGMQTVHIAKFDTGNEVSTKTDSPLVVTGRLVNAESSDSCQISDTNSEQIRNMLYDMQTIQLAKLDTVNKVSTKTDSPLVATDTLSRAGSPDSYQVKSQTTNSEHINMLYDMQTVHIAKLDTVNELSTDSPLVETDALSGAGSPDSYQMATTNPEQINMLYDMQTVHISKLDTVNELTDSPLAETDALSRAGSPDSYQVKSTTTNSKQIRNMLNDMQMIHIAKLDTVNELSTDLPLEKTDALFCAVSPDSYQMTTTYPEQIRNMLCDMQTVHISKLDTVNELSTDSRLVETDALSRAGSPDSNLVKSPNTNSEQINMLYDTQTVHIAKLDTVNELSTDSPLVETDALSRTRSPDSCLVKSPTTNSEQMGTMIYAMQTVQVTKYDTENDQ